MSTPKPEIYDVVAVGFGPSNLALAIAIEESPRPLTATILERQSSLGWHRGMLVPSAKMQVSFLKDLVTLRNPVSPFSFVSYLHDVGRLTMFINNQDLFATRQEFHRYLEWAESRLACPVSYNSEVTAIRLPAITGGGPADHVELVVRDPTRPGVQRVVAGRNIVISTGLSPRMPANVERGPHVWHSSEVLHRFREVGAAGLRRVAVVGAGQSAAEIVRFVHDTVPAATVFAIIPSYGYALADATPFANQVFDPAAVDDYFAGSDRSKEAIWKYHRNTNYSVVDDEVIRDLYQRAYDDEVAGTGRLTFLNLSRVEDVKRADSNTRVTVYSVAREESYDLDVDVLICATGYDPMDPTDLLGDLSGHCEYDEQGRLRVNRDYRLVTAPALTCGIYLQGGTEHTHGLASSLLSNIAVRSGEIVGSITARTENGVRA